MKCPISFGIEFRLDQPRPHPWEAIENEKLAFNFFPFWRSFLGYSGAILGHFELFYGHKYGFEGIYELGWTRKMSWNDKKIFWNFLPKKSKTHFLLQIWAFRFLLSTVTGQKLPFQIIVPCSRTKHHVVSSGYLENATT